MSENEQQLSGQSPDARREETAQPKLSESFFEMLLNPPSCKTSGVCDNCGRCER